MYSEAAILRPGLYVSLQTTSQQSAQLHRSMAVLQVTAMRGIHLLSSRCRGACEKAEICENVASCLFLLSANHLGQVKQIALLTLSALWHTDKRRSHDACCAADAGVRAQANSHDSTGQTERHARSLVVPPDSTQLDATRAATATATATATALCLVAAR